MYPGFARSRLQLATLGQTGVTGKKNCTVTVLWTAFPGGALDPVTGAQVGGESQEWSGTMSGLVHQVGAETKLRQFAEIQVGDQLLDIDPAGQIAVMGYATLASGTMPTGGTVALDDLDGVRFQIDGNLYTESDIGEGLAQAWNVLFGDQRLVRTLHLRTAT